jgi:hypothetical protein
MLRVSIRALNFAHSLGWNDVQFCVHLQQASAVGGGSSEITARYCVAPGGVLQIALDGTLLLASGGTPRPRRRGH